MMPILFRKSRVEVKVAARLDVKNFATLYLRSTVDLKLCVLGRVWWKADTHPV